MGWAGICKLFQKQSYDLLSHRHGTLLLIGGCILIIISAFQFGEVALEWSAEKYAAVFNSFSDNVAGRSYRNRLCLPVPIDVVYTWVNGSDPSMLAQLQRYKMMMEIDTNSSSEVPIPGTCSFSHCVPAAALVLEPALPSDVALTSLAILYPAFKPATRLYPMAHPTRESANVTVVMFENVEQVEIALKENVMLSGENVTSKQGFYTTEWPLLNGVLVHDTILMTGFPHTLTREDLLKAVPEKLKNSVTGFELHADVGVAVLTVPKSEDFETFLQDSNMTIDNKEPTLSAANFVWDLRDYSLTETMAANRFEDNDELRYSLRSIEQFAPWVRHVYIVTNGQLPSWLNLDSPRLTIVTHEEIFPNKSHLPTFSSPAIESHLHRIPGLSDKFLYLNDDVMFGREVWPDDFYTHARGQKIYLTWSVPSCQDGCPSSWIRDGYCDKACNNSECEWDGGDCKGGASGRTFGGDFGGFGGDWSQSESLYCHSGCSNNWIADKYCDTSCNVLECGFDAGDCGTDNYNKLYQLRLVRTQVEYVVPRGKTFFYFNISSLLGSNGSVDEASYTQSDVIRAAAVSLKFKVITVVLNSNQSAAILEFSVNGTDFQKNEFKLNLTVRVDTTTPEGGLNLAEAETKMQAGAAANISNAVGPTVEEMFHFEDVLDYLQAARPVMPSLMDPGYKLHVDLSDYDLPQELQARYDQLLEAQKEGDITEKGFVEQKAALWTRYLELLSVQGLEPVRRPRQENPGIDDLKQNEQSRREADGDTVLGEQDNGEQRKSGGLKEVVEDEIVPEKAVLLGIGDRGGDQWGRLQEEGQGRDVDNGQGDGALGDRALGDGALGDEAPVQQGDLGDVAHVDAPLGDGAPGDGAHINAALGDGAPGDGAPGDGAPGDAALRDGALGDGALGDGALGDGAPGDGAPGDAALRALGDGALGNGAPDAGALGDGAPGNGALGDGAFGDGAPDAGALGDGAPGDGAPGDAALRDGALGDGALGDGALGDSAPGDGAPGDTALRALGDGALGNGAPDAGALGDGAPGNGALGDGAFGDGAPDAGALGDGAPDAGALGDGALGDGAPDLSAPGGAALRDGALGDVVPGDRPLGEHEVHVKVKEDPQLAARVDDDQESVKEAPGAMGDIPVHSREDAPPNHVEDAIRSVKKYLNETKLQIQALDDQLQARQLAGQPGNVNAQGQHVEDTGEKPADGVKEKAKLEKGFEPDGFRTRKLNSMIVPGNDPAFLPWEKLGIFDDLQKKREAAAQGEAFAMTSRRGRRLLDTFGDSLRHVNKLFNKMYGYVARKVPAHMPHFIDRNAMVELQAKFAHEWDATSSHRIRSSDDMQFAFSFMYYVMSEPLNVTVGDLFSELDTDQSGTLSDREIRTLAARVYDLPLDLQTLTGLEAKFINCSQSVPLDPREGSYPQERYYDKNMPQVTRWLVVHCDPIIELLRRLVKSRTKYKHEVVSEDDVAFKMIRSNVSQVVGQLDDIRKHPKKFICLNDNMDHTRQESQTVKAVLLDFYESLFPVTSSFELPKEYRNRFLHVKELREWRKYRDLLKLWTQLALFFLVLFTLASFFSDKIEALKRKYIGRRQTAQTSREGSKGATSLLQRPVQSV